MLMNDVSLRGLIPNELGKGFGFFNSKPPSAFSPVVVTPEELGDAWRDTKLHRPLISTLNGTEQGRPNAGIDMQFGFDRLVAHAAKTRPLAAGCVIGSGTVSNRQENSGVSCLAETRMVETIESGKPQTSFMRFGDHIRIEMLDDEGRSIFGAIDQKVEKYEYQPGHSAETMKKAG
jgi:fumarylacetoacetate (FAA) hydrolase